MITPDDNWIRSARQYIREDECDCDCFLCARGDHCEYCEEEDFSDLEEDVI